MRAKTTRGPARAAGGSVAAALLGALLATSAGCAAGGSPPSLRTPTEFDEQVLKADRPVVVQFYSAGCLACRAFAPTISSLHEEYRDRALFFKIERSEGAELRVLFRVRAYPTVVLFVGGKEQSRWVNESSKKVYRQALDRALAR